MDSISIKIPVLIIKTTQHLNLILQLKSLLIKFNFLKVKLEMIIGFIFPINLMNTMIEFHSLILRVLFVNSVCDVVANLPLKFVILFLQ
jgi:hypothetical protein